MVKNAIKQGLLILLYPEREFKLLHKRTFESVLWDYLKLLLAVGIVGAVFTFALSVIRAIYFNIFMTIDVQYLRMINYSLGRVTSTIFFYLFAGTLLLFIISVILAPFFRKTKYTYLLQILFYSLTPFLLFSWIPMLLPSLIVWSLFLFIVGVRSQKHISKIKKNSLDQRD